MFGRLQNVSQLDLASIHNVWNEEYVRQHPLRLFPAVTDLRLLGWMQRGLVKAILTSLDADKLRSVKLDCLEDEGASADGRPMSSDFATYHAPNFHMTQGTGEELISDDLFNQQEIERALTFPGPSWTSLHLLQVQHLPMLSHLQIKLSSFDGFIDLRNYATVFAKTADCVSHVKENLQCLKFIFHERTEPQSLFRIPVPTGPGLHPLPKEHREISIRLVVSFLRRLLDSFRSREFPRLQKKKITGCHLPNADEEDPASDIAEVVGTIVALFACLPGVEIIEAPSTTFRPTFRGYKNIGNRRHG